MRPPHYDMLPVRSKKSKKPRLTSKPDGDQNDEDLVMMKHLYACLLPCPVHSHFTTPYFHVTSVAVKNLVTSGFSSSEPEEEHDSHVLQPEEAVKYVDKARKHSDFDDRFILVEDKLYSIGGHPLDHGTYWSPECMCFDLSGEAKDNEQRVLSKQEVSGELIEPMTSTKPYPCIAEIDGQIYVLSGLQEETLPDPFFEVYNPREGTWSRLPEPPFVAKARQEPEWYWLVGRFRTYSHFVYEKKLYVSSEYQSFAFDTRKKVWDKCELGLEFCSPFSDNFLDTEQQEMAVEANRILRGGPSFDFLAKAIVYSQTLICSVLDICPSVVAYRVVDGKVEGRQCLSVMNQHLKDAGAGEWGNIINIGGGYIGVVLYTYNADLHFVLKCMTFKVSEVGEIGANDSDPEILRCDYLKTFALDVGAVEPSACLPYIFTR